MIPLQAAGAAVQMGGAIFKTISGAKMAREAKEAIENYKRQELQNAYSNVQVSTLGSEYQLEEASRNTATAMDTLRSTGARGVLGGLGMVQANNNRVTQNIAANLDQQQKQLDVREAQDEARIRQMQEQREREDLAGLGQQYNTGRQDMFSGIGDIGQGLSSIGGMSGGFGGMTPQVSSVGQVASQGAVPFGGSALPQAPLAPNSMLMGGVQRQGATMIGGNANDISAPLMLF